MTPIVWLPGMMCDARLFAPQLDALGGQVILPTTETTIAEMAGAVLRDAPAQFALAGLSMGGIIAMEVVRQSPERVARLALMDTNPLPEMPEVAARRIPQIAKVQAGALATVMREDMKPNYLADGPHRAELLELCLAMALDAGPDAFVRQSRALQGRRDQQETLRGFRAPALVLCGREDALCPVARHRLMHDLMPQSRFVIIENAGHLPTLEQPELTTAALAAWMEA